jgi:hypothetical protein
MLSKTGLFFIDFLVEELLHVLGEHIVQDDLVDITRIGLLYAVFRVFLLLCRVSGPPLFSASSSHLILKYLVINNNQIDG